MYNITLQKKKEKKKAMKASFFVSNFPWNPFRDEPFVRKSIVCPYDIVYHYLFAVLLRGFDTHFGGILYGGILYEDIHISQREIEQFFQYYQLQLSINHVCPAES